MYTMIVVAHSILLFTIIIMIPLILSNLAKFTIMKIPLIMSVSGSSILGTSGKKRINNPCIKQCLQWLSKEQGFLTLINKICQGSPQLIKINLNNIPTLIRTGQDNTHMQQQHKIVAKGPKVHFPEFNGQDTDG